MKNFVAFLKKFKIMLQKFAFFRMNLFLSQYFFLRVKYRYSCDIDGTYSIIAQRLYKKNLNCDTYV